MDHLALHRAIAAACPILGIAIADPDDKATWRIDFDPSATEPQREAAQAALQAFDPSRRPCPSRSRHCKRGAPCARRAFTKR